MRIPKAKSKMQDSDYEQSAFQTFSSKVVPTTANIGRVNDPTKFKVTRKPRHPYERCSQRCSTGQEKQLNHSYTYAQGDIQ